MKKKQLFMFVLLWVISFSGYAQAHKANIEKRFSEFYELNRKGDIEKAMDYIPDELFAVIPKDQMVAAMKQLVNAKEFEYKILDWKMKSIKPPIHINGKYYAILNYNSMITMKFNGLEDAAIGLAKLSLANTFGADNVQMDEKTKVFTINAQKKSCAISIDGLDGWKFVDIEAKQRLLLDQILPKQILEEI